MRRTAKPAATETQIKHQIKQYLDLRGIFNYHVLQGVGSYRGLPDRVMHYQGRVIYLEIKTPSGSLRADQAIFQGQCQADDIDYWVIRDVEELHKRIELMKDIPQQPRVRIAPRLAGRGRFEGGV